MTSRLVAVGLHSVRPEALDAACDFIAGLTAEGIRCMVRPERAAEIAARVPDARLVPLIGDRLPEIAVVFGGDGTILRTAEWALPRGVPLLGVNLGHVGFLAELEVSQTQSVLRAVVERTFRVEERTTLAVTVYDRPGGTAVWESFAINEVSVEKAAREKMVDLMVHVDGRPLSRWSADGLLVATPTGSTAYAFSANGPVMWPDVDAMLLVPLSAHALFARPLVLSPSSHVSVQLLQEHETHAVVWCDGRRPTDLCSGMVIEVRRNQRPLLIARTSEQPFTTRLVRKFGLPIDSFRTRGASAG